MSEQRKPSDVAEQLATALDDNVNVPLPMLLQFELDLAEHPFDQTTRRCYYDWLLEHGCLKRAEQLAGELEEHDPPEYTGPVRPDEVYDWAGL
jgi:uncharacterized protein (TIGR02996 family)